MLTLTSTQRRELRARAHGLHPVVHVGHGGLTPAVIHEIDVALKAHELVKVRVHSDDRDEREAHLGALCEALDAGPVQHLGKMLVVWRPAPTKEPLAIARTRGGKAGKRSRERLSKPSGRGGSPAEPKVGARARRHRRGAARHAPAPITTIDAPRASKRRPGKTASEPIVPSTTASRGRRYAGGQAVMPGNPRAPTSRRRASVSSAAKPAPLPRSPGAGTPPARPPKAAVKRPPKGTKRRPSGGAPPSVQRRRRPTGGR
ncbi:MAG TPA: YhbY family RNA-binding protein [Casimicrobiaceae bacterium]|nr:YhbY family RNA-binding protein [Casimicrobiaceae bacterium]